MTMLSDDELLSGLPEHFQFGTMLKATPVIEGGDRIIYVEASKESLDQQNEIVLSKALKDSVDIFKKFGVLDLDHKSMPSVAAKYGIENPEDWIIGQPLDVIFNGKTTIVKAQLRSGDTPLAERATRVWDGLTKVNPPDRYYASVGGSVLAREIRIDPDTKNRVPVITKTRWNNLALSLLPVNPDLEPATVTPIGTFAKSMGGYVIKTMMAGYGTDSAELTGGGAMRLQSLYGSPVNYFDFRNELSSDLRKGSLGANPGASDMVTHCGKKFGLSRSDAAEYVERFYRDIIKRRSKTNGVSHG